MVNQNNFRKGAPTTFVGLAAMLQSSRWWHVGKLLTALLLAPLSMRVALFHFSTKDDRSNAWNVLLSRKRDIYMHWRRFHVVSRHFCLYRFGALICLHGLKEICPMHKIASNFCPELKILPSFSRETQM